MIVSSRGTLGPLPVHVKSAPYIARDHRCNHPGVELIIYTCLTEGYVGVRGLGLLGGGYVQAKVLGFGQKSCLTMGTQTTHVCVIMLHGFASGKSAGSTMPIR